eukprot:3465763-Pyramimonas_sp.AAC.1
MVQDGLQDHPSESIMPRSPPKKLPRRPNMAPEATNRPPERPPRGPPMRPGKAKIIDCSLPRLCLE